MYDILWCILVAGACLGNSVGNKYRQKLKRTHLYQGRPVRHSLVRTQPVTKGLPASIVAARQESHRLCAQFKLVTSAERLGHPTAGVLSVG
jgi:hypothetical protein